MAALRPICRDMKKRIKGGVPRRTGALRAAIDYKVKAKNGRAYGVVGVRYNWQAPAKFGSIKLRRRGGKTETYGIIPNFYNRYAKPAITRAFNKDVLDTVFRYVKDAVKAGFAK